jgi:hypothetical protein
VRISSSPPAKIQTGRPTASKQYRYDQPVFSPDATEMLVHVTEGDVPQRNLWVFDTTGAHKGTRIVV